MRMILDGPPLTDQETEEMFKLWKKVAKIEEEYKNNKKTKKTTHIHLKKK